MHVKGLNRGYPRICHVPVILEINLILFILYAVFVCIINIIFNNNKEKNERQHWVQNRI